MKILDKQRLQLDREGYLVLEDLMPAEFLKATRKAVAELFEQEADLAGSEFKQEPGCRRLANLVDKGDVFQDLVSHPNVLPWVESVLGPEFKLSSLNARSVNPVFLEAQPLHSDMAAVVDERGFWVCNTVWMLDDFTQENGPLRAVPGSHRAGTLPQEALADPVATHPDEIVITGGAGTVVVMNAHLWHGGLANRTNKPRTAVHAFYARRDKPQQQYQKRLLRPSLQSRLSPKLRWLLALDDPLNDRLSTEDYVRSGFMK